MKDTKNLNDKLRKIFMCTIWKHDPKMVGILDRHFHSREIFTFGDIENLDDEQVFKGTRARREERETFLRSLMDIGLRTKANNLV